MAAQQIDWVTGDSTASPGLVFCLVGGTGLLIGGMMCIARFTSAQAKLRCIKVAALGGVLLALGAVWAAISTAAYRARMFAADPVRFAVGTDVFGTRWVDKPL